MYRGIIILAILSLVLGGCSYAVKPATTSAVDVYSSYDDKVRGTWIIVIDDDVENITRKVHASSYVCSAHTYPIEVGSSFSTSIKRTMKSIFENTVEKSSLPSASELKNSDVNGSVLVKLDTFDPSVRCSMGMWSGSCTGKVDMELGVIVRGKNGKLLATSVGDSSTVEGDAGGVCEGAANVLADATTKSLKETLEKMAERLINSAKIRNATINTASNNSQNGNAVNLRDAKRSTSASYYANTRCGRIKGNLKFLGISNKEERYSVTCDSGELLVIGCSEKGCKSL